jgi:hypothetical protein
MSMTPFNGDLLQPLKWLHNNASAMQKLVRLKATWYEQYNTQYWVDWEYNVFDIRTASPFGLMIWCIILGVPSGGFGLYPSSAAWAYGEERQNYIYSGANPSLPDPNTIGGNFFGGGDAEILDLNEIRNTLRLRYVALVNNGSVAFINKMLRYIFNNGEPWGVAGGRYFYLADCTCAQGASLPAFQMEYRIGPAMNLSPQLIAIYNDPKYGIMPSSSGSKITVIQE